MSRAVREAILQMGVGRTNYGSEIENKVICSALKKQIDPDYKKSIDDQVRKEIDELYLEKCQEVNRLKKELELLRASEDTKKNLCDTCERCNEIPTCMCDDMKFGDGFGNDNIIGCSNYEADCTVEKESE